MKFLPLVLAISLFTTGSMVAPSDQDQQAAVSIIAAVGQYAYTDGATNNGAATLIEGWAFECSSGSQGDIDVVIDGQVFEANGGNSFRIPRADVWLGITSTGVCDIEHTPFFSGFSMLLSNSQFSPGVHVAQIWIKNANGVRTPSINARAFTIQ